MDIKALMRTKTFWTGLAAVVTGVGMMIDGHNAEGMQTIVLGLLAITGRDAVLKK